MPDFRAILRKAREGAVLRGAAGASGATPEKASDLNACPGRDGGPTAETRVGPVGPPVDPGPTGPKRLHTVGPAYGYEERLSEQCVSGAGPTGPTGPSEQQGVCKNGGSTEPHQPAWDSDDPLGSDWWTGRAMAEADALVPPVGEPLPISASDVRAGVARELRHLAGLGITDLEVERRAVSITAGKIRNSAALAERQANGGRCHECGEPLDETRPVVAVLQADGRLWLHGDGCHDALSRRKAALVERIMAAAGYGADPHVEERTEVRERALVEVRAVATRGDYEQDGAEGRGSRPTFSRSASRV